MNKIKKQSLNKMKLTTTLKEIIKEKFLKEQESIVDKDLKAARKVQRQLLNVFVDIGKAHKAIVSNLSSFNSPGFRKAFFDAIRVGMEGPLLNTKWNRQKAAKTLDDYFKGR